MSAQQTTEQENMTKTYYHVTQKSSNKKTGPIMVTTSSANTCPDTCKLKDNGCYASSGPSAIHWRKVSSGERGISEAEFLQQIERFSYAGEIWRHNQAGDLPHNDGFIDHDFVKKLCFVNRGLGFTYTHHALNRQNKMIIDYANSSGFTVNVSTDNVKQAKQLKSENPDLLVVTILPLDYADNDKEILRCPAEYKENVTCARCKLCAISKRSKIIGFTAHGTSKKKVDLIAKST